MGAHVSAQDGKTALDFAKQNGSDVVARLIEVRFANMRRCRPRPFAITAC